MFNERVFKLYFNQISRYGEMRKVTSSNKVGVESLFELI